MSICTGEALDRNCLPDPRHITETSSMRNHYEWSATGTFGSHLHITSARRGYNYDGYFSFQIICNSYLLCYSSLLLLLCYSSCYTNCKFAPKARPTIEMLIGEARRPHMETLPARRHCRTAREPCLHALQIAGKRASPFCD